MERPQELVASHAAVKLLTRRANLISMVAWTMTGPSRIVLERPQVQFVQQSCRHGRHGVEQQKS